WHLSSPRFLSYRCVHHRDLHSFPTRRSSDLTPRAIILSVGGAGAGDFVAASPSAPNEPGTHRVSVTYTLPDDPEEGWTVRLFKRSEEHTSELQSRFDLVCRLLLEKKKTHQRQ